MVGVTLPSNSLFDFPGINDLGLSHCVFIFSAELDAWYLVGALPRCRDCLNESLGEASLWALRE